MCLFACNVEPGDDQVWLRHLVHCIVHFGLEGDLFIYIYSTLSGVSTVHASYLMPQCIQYVLVYNSLQIRE